MFTAVRVASICNGHLTFRSTYTLTFVTRRMNRRHLLVALGGLSAPLSGCSSRGDDSSIGSTPSSPTATRTPASVSGVRVPPCPERPESFTRDSVREFAFQFERAALSYQTAREQEGLASVDVDIVTEKESSVTRADDGWIVRFYVQGPATTYEDGSHGDPGLFRVHYYISEEKTFRVEALDSKPDPREQGTEAQCPPE